MREAIADVSRGGQDYWRGPINKRLALHFLPPPCPLLLSQNFWPELELRKKGRAWKKGVGLLWGGVV